MLMNWQSDLQSLNPELNDDGIIVVGSRMGDAAKQWGRSLPAFLPRESKCRKLFCLTKNNEHHAGVYDIIEARICLSFSQIEPQSMLKICLS